MPWLTVIALAVLVVGVVVYAGPRGKIRRHGHEPLTLLLGILLCLLALAYLWATA